jgi:hypothetical protein
VILLRHSQLAAMLAPRSINPLATPSTPLPASVQGTSSSLGIRPTEQALVGALLQD